MSSLYSGKTLFRKMECGCVYEATYYLSGYDKESIARFIVCSKCSYKESELTDEEIENKEQKIINNLWNEEMQEPGTTDDNWHSSYLYCV